MSRVADAVADAARKLTAAGIENADLDASLLMVAAAGVSRERILVRDFIADESAIARFDSFVARRAAREPLAYIVGHKEFYSLDFIVTPDVLIPRPETEILVEAALKAAETRGSISMLDIGTGSGAIAIAIAHHAPAARVTAVDISPVALEIARRNAAKHGLSSRVDLRIADLFEIRDDLDPLGKFDLIVSNPPYISASEIGSLEPEVRDYEPRIATVAGSDGLECYRRIAAGAGTHLEPGGTVIVEIGAAQNAAVRKIFAREGFAAVSQLSDLAGLPRTLVMRTD